MEHAEGLTAQQAAVRWPDQAEAVREHAVICLWRRNPPKGARGVYVHVTERDGGDLAGG